MKSGVPGVDECRRIWNSGRTLAEVTPQLLHTRLNPRITSSAIDNAQQPDAETTQTPLVWTMLEETEDLNSVEWLLNKCLFGKLAPLKLLQSGVTVPLEIGERQSACSRLETVIKVTVQRRSRYVQNPDDILLEDTVGKLLKEWKDDYRSWMNQASQRDWYHLEVDERHEFERTRFRAFLWKMCGHYDLPRFWLRVPASWMSLRIFKQMYVDGDPWLSKNTKMQRAVQAVGDALTAKRKQMNSAARGYERTRR